MLVQEGYFFSNFLLCECFFWTEGIQMKHMGTWPRDDIDQLLSFSSVCVASYLFARSEYHTRNTILCTHQRTFAVHLWFPFRIRTPVWGFQLSRNRFRYLQICSAGSAWTLVLELCALSRNMVCHFLQALLWDFSRDLLLSKTNQNSSVIPHGEDSRTNFADLRKVSTERHGRSSDMSGSERLPAWVRRPPQPEPLSTSEFGSFQDSPKVSESSTHIWLCQSLFFLYFWSFKWDLNVNSRSNSILIPDKGLTCQSVHHHIELVQIEGRQSDPKIYKINDQVTLEVLRTNTAANVNVVELPKRNNGK